MGKCNPRSSNGNLGNGKGGHTKGVFSLEDSLESLNSLESLEKWSDSPFFSILWGPDFGLSRFSKSLGNGQTPCPKTPFFQSRGSKRAAKPCPSFPCFLLECKEASQKQGCVSHRTPDPLGDHQPYTATTKDFGSKKGFQRGCVRIDRT